MYLGHGQIIQAPQTGEVIQIDHLDLASTVAATRPSALGRPWLMAKRPSKASYRRPALRRTTGD
jgi:cell wall-associated NlpC family hydrolase